MLAIAYRSLGNREAAEDVVQIATLKAIRSYRRFRGDCTMRSWFRIIVSNTCHNYRRALKDNVDIDTVYLHAPEIPDYDEFGERKKLLKKEIEALPPRQKEVLTKRIYEGLSFKEIAYDMNICYDTAKAHYRHALLKVTQKIRNPV